MPDVLTHWCLEKWPQICRWHSQLLFSYVFLLHFDWYFTEIYPQWSNWQYTSIVLDNVFTSNRRQAIFLIQSGASLMRSNGKGQYIQHNSDRIRTYRMYIPGHWCWKADTCITMFEEKNHNQKYRLTIWWLLNVNAYELFIYTDVYLPRSADRCEELCEWWCNLLVHGARPGTVWMAWRQGVFPMHPAGGFLTAAVGTSSRQTVKLNSNDLL